MFVVGFFRNFFNSFSSLVDFVTSYEIPQWTLHWDFNPWNLYIYQNGTITIATILSGALVSFLILCLILHLWHLVKLIF